MSKSILSGVRVLELDNGLAQFTGKMLADMGADVIKIEPSSGVPARTMGPFYKDEPDINKSLHFWHYNTSKRSITLDLYEEKGRDVFEKLVATSDIVLDGLGLNEMASYNLDYNQLSQKHPHLIYCYITPFGIDGPWASYKSSDLVHLGLGGTMSASGYDDKESPPIAATGGQANHMVSMFAAMGIMSALIYREQTSEGQLIDVSVHDAINVSTEMAIPFWEFQGENVVRRTARHALVNDSPPWNHRCKDGKYAVCLTLYMNFEALVEWLDEEGRVEDLKDEKYLDEDYRLKHLDHIVDIIREFCADHTSDYIFEEAQKRNIAWGIVNHPEDLFNVPHLLNDRRVFENIYHEEIEEIVLYPGAPYKFSGTPWNIKRRPPQLGEHTREILNEINDLTESEINSKKEVIK